MPGHAELSHIHGPGPISTDFDSGTHAPAPKARPASSRALRGDSRLDRLQTRNSDATDGSKPAAGVRAGISRNTLPNARHRMKARAHEDTSGSDADTESSNDAASPSRMSRMQPMRLHGRRGSSSASSASSGSSVYSQSSATSLEDLKPAPLNIRKQAATADNPARMSSNFAGEDIASVFAQTPGSTGAPGASQQHVSDDIPPPIPERRRPPMHTAAAATEHTATPPATPSSSQATTSQPPAAQTSPLATAATPEPKPSALHAQQATPSMNTPPMQQAPMPQHAAQGMHAQHPGFGPHNAGPHAGFAPQFAPQAPRPTMRDRVRNFFGMPPVNGAYGPMGANNNYGNYGQGSQLSNFAMPMIGMVSSVANIAVSMLSAMLNLAENMARKTEELSRKN